MQVTNEEPPFFLKKKGGQPILEERVLTGKKERERVGHLNLFFAEADTLLQTAQSSQGTVKSFYQILSIATQISQ